MNVIQNHKYNWEKVETFKVLTDNEELANRGIQYVLKLDFSSSTLTILSRDWDNTISIRYSNPHPNAVKAFAKTNEQNPQAPFKVHHAFSVFLNFTNNLDILIEFIQIVDTYDPLEKFKDEIFTFISAKKAEEIQELKVIPKWKKKRDLNDVSINSKVLADRGIEYTLELDGMDIESRFLIEIRDWDNKVSIRYNMPNSKAVAVCQYINKQHPQPIFNIVGDVLIKLDFTNNLDMLKQFVSIIHAYDSLGEYKEEILTFIGVKKEEEIWEFIEETIKKNDINSALNLAIQEQTRQNYNLVFLLADYLQKNFSQTKQPEIYLKALLKIYDSVLPQHKERYEDLHNNILKFLRESVSEQMLINEFKDAYKLGNQLKIDMLYNALCLCDIQLKNLQGSMETLLDTALTIRKQSLEINYLKDKLSYSTNTKYSGTVWKKAPKSMDIDLVPEKTNVPTGMEL